MLEYILEFDFHRRRKQFCAKKKFPEGYSSSASNLKDTKEIYKTSEQPMNSLYDLCTLTQQSILHDQC